MEIRKATLKDVPVIVRLWEEFMKDHRRTVVKNNPRLKPYEAHKASASRLFKKFIAKNIRSRNSLVLLAQDGERPAGYCLSMINKTIAIFALDRIGYISDLFVRKEYRGNGISTRFKDETANWLKRRGIRHVSIKVHTDNPRALKIYTKWGFMDYHLEMRKKI